MIEALPFNTGEMLILGLSLLVITISAFLPLRFSVLQVVYIILFNIFLGVVVDQLISIPPYDLYDVLTPKLTFGDMVIYLFLYPPTVYIFMFLADFIGFHRWKWMIVFLAVWSLFTLLFEWILSKQGVYVYKKWNLYLSEMSYLILYGLNLGVLYFIKYRTARRDSHN